MEKYQYYIVKIEGKAYSTCPGQENVLIDAVREGSAWASSVGEAIEIYSNTHAGYFCVDENINVSARVMTDEELIAWEKNNVFPSF